jgi:3'-5' exoribonuclease
MFPEALMLHYLDDLDSKMEAMRAHFARESEQEGPWTSYNASLGRPLLDSRKFMPDAASHAPNGSQPSPPAADRQSDDLQSGERSAADQKAEAPSLDLFSEQKA